METKLKILTALTIPYVFLCAGLYHLAFWSPFCINIFTFLDVADIIKSIIYPFFYSSFAVIFMSIIQYTPSYNIYPYGGGNSEAPTKRKKFFLSFLKTAYAFLLIYLVVFHYDKWRGQYVPWVILPAFYHITVEFLLKKEVIKHDKSYFIAIYILVLLPVFSYTSGTSNARRIYENYEYDYSTYIIPNKPLKFLAKASDHYVFISIDNKEKYFFSTDEVKGLSLIEHKTK